MRFFLKYSRLNILWLNKMLLLQCLLMTTFAFSSSGLLHSQISTENFQRSEYNRIIDHFMDAGDLSAVRGDDRAMLAASYFNRAEIMSVLFDMGVDMLHGYTILRDTVRSENRSAYNDYFYFLASAYKKSKNNQKQHRTFSLDLKLDQPRYNLQADIFTQFLNNRSIESDHLYGVLLQAVHQYHRGGSIDCRVHESSNAWRCKLFSSVINRDMIDQYATVGEKITNTAPEIIINFDSHTSLQYSDPVDFFLISLHDYFMAYSMLSVMSDRRMVHRSAIAAFEAGLLEESEEIFKTFQDELSVLYLDALNYRKNPDISGLNRLLEHSRSVNPRIALLSLELATRFNHHMLDGSLLSSIANSVSQIDGSSLPLAMIKARVLIITGHPDKAVVALESHYSRSDHNNIRRIRHDHLALLSHSKYLAGRRYFGDSISHLISLNREYPMIQSYVFKLQEIIQPQCPECGRHTVN